MPHHPFTSFKIQTYQQKEIKVYSGINLSKTPKVWPYAINLLNAELHWVACYLDEKKAVYVKRLSR